MPEYDKYLAALHQYALPWNAFFVPETGNSEVYAHYFFAALGDGAWGWSPFGMDKTGYGNYPLGAARIDEETLKPFVLDYQIVAPMSRELARWVQEGRGRRRRARRSTRRSCKCLPCMAQQTIGRR